MESTEEMQKETLEIIKDFKEKINTSLKQMTKAIETLHPEINLDIEMKTE